MKALAAIGTYGLIVTAFALTALTVLEVVVWP